MQHRDIKRKTGVGVSGALLLLVIVNQMSNLSRRERDIRQMRKADVGNSSSKK